MGGSRGGDNGAAQRAQQQQQQIAKMQAEQAAAAKEAARLAQLAVDQKSYMNSVNSALQQASKGTEAAQEQLGVANQQQQAIDTAAQQAQQAAFQSGAQGAIGGGGFNPQAAAKAGIANIGATGSGVVTPAQASPAAQAVAAARQNNVTGAGSNQFTLPSSSGIKLGGS